MKRDGVYRFNLQFPADTQEHIRVGEVLERLGKRKSHLVVAALGEYLDRHPQWETPEVRVKIEQQSALTREKAGRTGAAAGGGEAGLIAGLQSGSRSRRGGRARFGHLPDAGELGAFSKLG